MNLHTLTHHISPLRLSFSLPQPLAVNHRGRAGADATLRPLHNSNFIKTTSDLCSPSAPVSPSQWIRAEVSNTRPVCWGRPAVCILKVKKTHQTSFSIIKFNFWIVHSGHTIVIRVEEAAVNSRRTDEQMIAVCRLLITVYSLTKTSLKKKKKRRDAECGVFR